WTRVNMRAAPNSARMVNPVKPSNNGRFAILIDSCPLVGEADLITSCTNQVADVGRHAWSPRCASCTKADHEYVQPWARVAATSQSPWNGQRRHRVMCDEIAVLFAVPPLLTHALPCIAGISASTQGYRSCAVGAWLIGTSTAGYTRGLERARCASAAERASTPDRGMVWIYAPAEAFDLKVRAVVQWLRRARSSQQALAAAWACPWRHSTRRATSAGSCPR